MRRQWPYRDRKGIFIITTIITTTITTTNTTITIGFRMKNIATLLGVDPGTTTTTSTTTKTNTNTNTTTTTTSSPYNCFWYY